MNTRNPLRTNRIMWAAGLGVVTVSTAVLAFSAASASAAASDVRLAGVNCAASPEVVEIKNYGDQEQDLTGRKLESDGNDPFSLSAAGTIPAGASIFVESGPGAQAAFTWSQSQIFRDNDPTDYARLVDNTGVTKSQAACAQATAAPTAPPTAAPTSTKPAGQVPNGGGPPGTPDHLVSPLTLIYLGGSAMAAVAGAALSWMGIGAGLERRRKRRAGADAEASDVAVPEPTVVEVSLTPIQPQAKPRREGQHEFSSQPLLLALIVALAAAILVALLTQAGEGPKRR
ncbi:MAG TPA: lamin tail domain-containing protein [Dehalococcoidia bacterium]|nr:lamin tail domain-containing protein [Dehalococcoidia bacterium]